MTLIAARFCGPPDSANGGYCAGLLSKALGGVVEVTLRRPPPLDRELSIVHQGERAELRWDGELVAEAQRATLAEACPPPPSFERAVELSSHYVGHRAHHFSTCFACGPARKPGDGLRIFPGAEQAGDPVAAPWVPDASLPSAGGVVLPEIIWAALDCIGYFAVAAPEYPMALLGRMTTAITGEVRVGERCVVTGFNAERSGRKLFASTAVFGEDGTLRAHAKQTWICLSSPPSSRTLRAVRPPNNSGNGPTL